MDSTQFDTRVRELFGRASRRSVALKLGAIASVPLLGRNFAIAKKKKGKKKPLCLDGQTVSASSKKRKKLIRQGATPGACCVPACNGSTCGGNDGCGGTCSCNAGSVCNAGTCTACTVTCSGTPLGCGSQLTQALLDGGQIVLCPGRYAGIFRIEKDAALIGAGAGSDPATNTILDGEGKNPVLVVYPEQTASLQGLRVVNGFQVVSQGGGLVVQDSADVRVINCAFEGNMAPWGGGISSRGALRVTNTLFERNEATSSQDSGGGLGVFGADATFITDCTFTGNTAAGFGGGLMVTSSNVTITGSRFERNTAQRGGGLAMNQGVVSLDSATMIANNTAAVLGGGVARFDGTFTQNGATISGNNAPTQPNCAGVSCA